MNDFFEKKTTVDRSPQEIDQQTDNLVKMWKQRTRYPTKTKERITEEEVRITEILKDHNKRILSLGSGTSLRDYENVVRVDFNDKFRPTVIADINEPLIFGDGTFDVVVASYVLPWLIDPVRTINEMLRVVKKDGLVIFNGVQPIKDNVGTLLFANLEDSEAEHENIIIVYSPSYDWVILKPLTLDWSIGYVLDEEASVTIKTHGNEDFGEQDTPWGKRYIADYARFV